MSIIYFEDYRYGMMLAEQGIGLWELSRDWPEVCLKANTPCAATTPHGGAAAIVSRLVRCGDRPKVRYGDRPKPPSSQPP